MLPAYLSYAFQLALGVRVRLLDLSEHLRAERSDLLVAIGQLLVELDGKLLDLLAIGFGLI